MANLEPYMKEDIQFTTDDFKELYDFYINPNTLYNSDYLFDLVIN